MYYNLNVIIYLLIVHQVTEKQPKEKGVTMRLHLPVRAENGRVHPPAQLTGIIISAHYVIHNIVCPQIWLFMHTVLIAIARTFSTL